MNLARTNLSNVINNRIFFFLIEYLHSVEIAAAVIFSRLSLSKTNYRKKNVWSRTYCGSKWIRCFEKIDIIMSISGAINYYLDDFDEYRDAWRSNWWVPKGDCRVYVGNHMFDGYINSVKNKKY